MSEALTALRVSGSVVLDHTYATPWAIAVPSSDGLRHALAIETAARVVAFHIVEHGEFELRSPGNRVIVGPGELAVCFGGAAHQMQRGDTRAIDLGDILAERRAPPPGDALKGSTKLLCGVFILHDPALNPLLGSLPDVMTTRALDGELEGTTRLLIRELRDARAGGAFVIDRLLEVLCANVLRVHLSSPDARPRGLLRALADERICAALERFHRDPAGPWNVEALAKCAALSRSRFSALFAEHAGEGVMSYVAKWRMNLAARMLKTRDWSVEQVAAEVGYQNVPAFSRTFKRHLGTSPGSYRRTAR